MSDSEKNIAGEEHSASGTNAESLAFSEEERAATAESMAHLDAVLAQLIGPDGCPWDKEQSPHSLGDYLAEEMFELIDAIRRNDVHNVREELGDVLFLLFFVARLYSGQTNDRLFLAHAMRDSGDKMVRRHPHVFSGEKFATREDLLQAWERIKRAEKSADAESAVEDKKEAVFASLPAGLPPLLKAYRIHSKAARVGFTWEEDDDVAQQFESEWLEWLDADSFGSQAEKEKEFGDMLFPLVELGRRKGLKANAALELTNIKFLRRFAKMEALAKERGQKFSELELTEKDALWNEIKEREKCVSE